jgi:LuxR family transcriptional regulator, maltose regulon positive regulatory protein
VGTPNGSGVAVFAEGRAMSRSQIELKSCNAVQLGLAESKIRIPRLSARLINRSRLTQLLDEAVLTAGVTLLQAPAGYGKTSLLSQWAAAKPTASVAWMTVTSADDEPSTLLVYLASALRLIDVAIDENTRQAVFGKSISRPEIVTQALVNCILRDPRTLTLCMDDVHLISEKSAIDCISTLIENTHNNFRVVMATRETPSILLGRVRAYGNLAEIGVEQLRFRTNEIVEFFTQSGPPDLSDLEVGVIEERTEGWAAGLRMTSVVLAGKQDRAEMLGSLTGGRRQLAAFFGEEILARQPQALQQFLLRTSILERFCADLCTAVSGVKDAQSWIEDCESRGLFVMPLDECKTWYRYHHLFGQFMQRKLQEQLRDELPDLHRAACEWLCAAGLHVEAFDHALAAGMPERAGEILEAQCDNLFTQGKQPTVMRLASRLPDHVRNRLPKVLLSITWRLIAAWRIHEAEEILAIARARLLEMRNDPAHDPASIELIENYILHREMTIAIFRDEVVLAEQYAEKLLLQFPRANPYLKASIYHDLIDTGRLQFKLGHIDRTVALAREQLAIAASEHAHVFHASVIGSAYFLAGRAEAAIAALSNGMAIARRLSGHSDSLVAVAAMPLSAVLYERNDVGAARELVDRYLGPAAALGLVEQLIAGWVTRARLHWLDHAADQAIRVLKDAKSFAEAHGFERLKSAVEAELVRLLLLSSRLDEATAICPEMGNGEPSGELMPKRNATLRQSEYASIWVRLALAHGRIGESLTVIRHWRRLLASTQAAPVILNWELLFARSLSLDGKQAEALRVLDQAISKAESGRFIRTFLDEGGVIANLLQQLAQKKAAAPPGTEPFCSELIGLFRAEHGEQAEATLSSAEQSGILGSMSRRELQVLSLAASRISNREIGESLGLTEGSVKWYLQQVYDKIGVRRRSEAARKARRLGLIA